MRDPSRVYRWLLRLYPARFREEYATVMERQFLDDYRDTASIGGRIWLWLRTIEDLALSAPLAFFREVSRDLWHSARLYRTRSLSALVAVLALGLAMGASTGVFSVVNALLMRSLPFVHPEKLAELWRPAVGPGHGRKAFLEWRTRSAYLQGTAAFTSSEMNLNTQRDAVRVNVAETTANFFELLGARLAVGRPFSADEDVPGRAATAVISYALWQQLFGGDYRVTGATLRLNGAPLTVIGVAPPKFDYPAGTSIWVSSIFDYERVPKRGAFVFHTIGRVRPELSLSRARGMFEAEASATSPRAARIEINQDPPRMIPLRDQLAGPVRQALWVLAGMIALVLLAACANVSQLLLSRSTERRQELALRSALGASRARLMQQLITEATALTMTGAALGLFGAYWVAQIATSVVPAQLAAQQYTIFDSRVFSFALMLALGMAVVFGVIPVMVIGRTDLSNHLTRTQPGAREVGPVRVRSLLVALQATLTLALLAGSVVMGRTFLRTIHADLGFQPSHVITLNVSVQGTKYRSGASEWQFYTQALDRIRAVRGVVSAGAVSHLPLSNDVLMASAFQLDNGRTVGPVVMNAATPGYFQAIGTPILAGRDLDFGEAKRPEIGVVVNEAFAMRTGLGMAVLGHRLKSPWSDKPYVIAGIAGTARLGGPDDPGGPQVYWPVEEEPPPALTFVARVGKGSESLLPACRDAVRSIDREVPVYDVKTLEERLSGIVARPKFYTVATLFLATVAVLLAVVGVYGTASYSVARRTREMGIRIALGAPHHRIRNMMLRENLAPVAAGMIAGVAVAMAAGQYLEHLLVHAEPLGVVACSIAAGLLSMAGFVACWSATSRVLAIDPAEAVRAE